MHDQEILEFSVAVHVLTVGTVTQHYSTRINRQRKRASTRQPIRPPETKHTVHTHQAAHKLYGSWQVVNYQNAMLI